jgi:hypothetical protein
MDGVKERWVRAPDHVRVNNLIPHAHLRTWTRHETDMQSGNEASLVLVRRGNRDVFTFFPRKSLRLILQSLHKRIAADRVHNATMNLLYLFVNAEQQSEKRPS